MARPKKWARLEIEHIICKVAHLQVMNNHSGVSVLWDLFGDVLEENRDKIEERTQALRERQGQTAGVGSWRYG